MTLFHQDELFPLKHYSALRCMYTSMNYQNYSLSNICIKLQLQLAVNYWEMECFTAIQTLRPSLTWKTKKIASNEKEIYYNQPLDSIIFLLEI